MGAPNSTTARLHG